MKVAEKRGSVGKLLGKSKEKKQTKSKTKVTEKTAKQPAKIVSASGEALNSKRGRASNKAKASVISTELIQTRAYYIWENKGRPDNTDQENWIEAEKQLRKEL